MRVVAAAHDAEHLDVVMLGQRAREGQDGPDGPAHAPGVHEHDPHGGVLRVGPAGTDPAQRRQQHAPQRPVGTAQRRGPGMAVRHAAMMAPRS